MISSKHDEHGNFVCDECMCHVPPHLVTKHNCPQWLKMLVEMKKKNT